MRTHGLLITIRTTFEAQFVPASLERLHLLGVVDPLAAAGAAVETVRVDGAGGDVLFGRTGLTLAYEVVDSVVGVQCSGQCSWRTM